MPVGGVVNSGDGKRSGLLAQRGIESAAETRRYDAAQIEWPPGKRGGA
jgi:hypothetical protein